MRKLLVFLGCLLIVVLVSPLFIGFKAKSLLEKQYQDWQKSTIVEIVSRDYKQGYFSSSEHLVLRVRPTLLKQLADGTPAQIKTVLSEPVEMVNTITHFPLFTENLFGADVSTEFKFTPATDKILTQFFGKNLPLEMLNKLSWSGSKQTKVAFNPFTYQELSGIEVNWSGLQSTSTYNHHIDEYNTQMLANHLIVDVAKKANFQLNDFVYSSLLKMDQLPLNLHLNIGKIVLDWDEELDATLQLNDLIRILSRLQIGGVVNPNISLLPHSVSLADLKFNFESATKDDFTQIKALLSFEQFLYGTDKYGPMNINLKANHLYAHGLKMLNNKFNKLSRESSNEEEWRIEALAALREEGIAVFLNNPEFIIDAKVATPSGIIAVDGNIQFNNLTKEDLNDFSAIISKSSMKLNYQFPRQLLENILIERISEVFTVSDDLEIDEKEMNKEIYKLINGAINLYIANGFIISKDNMLSGWLSLKDGELLYNDKKRVIVDEDEEVFNQLLDDIE